MAVTSSQTHQDFSPKEMMAEAEKFALSKANKTSSMTLGLAIMAGAVYRFGIFVLHHSDNWQCEYKLGFKPLSRWYRLQYGVNPYRYLRW